MLHTCPSRIIYLASVKLEFLQFHDRKEGLDKAGSLLAVRALGCSPGPLGVMDHIQGGVQKAQHGGHAGTHEVQAD